ncbi:MAG TPA: patatin-like phospholipase family protein [Chthoniobacteraceae bacterium]|jgi:hypothetical protein|nr:patatin-like phospholipase family protein [Chthoniobacteraceae bacterium]
MSYHLDLRRLEAAAVAQRRENLKLPADRVKQPPSPGPDELPPDTVGLALSGGGIRCASFSLGVLGALAKKRRLRFVDILSSVSGGGYAGTFLGRLATRENIRVDPQPCARLEEIVANDNSPQMRWLRSHANFILSAGSDAGQHLAVLWRNLVTVYFVLATLAFCLFALLRFAEPLATWVRFPLAGLLSPEAGHALSAWWWTPLAALALGVLPAGMAYFIAPKPRSRGRFSFIGATVWLILLVLAVVGSTWGGSATAPLLGLAGVLVIAAVYLELARIGLPAALDFGATGQQSIDPADFIRNRLTRASAAAGVIFFLCLVFVIVDTLARGLAQGSFAKAIAGWGVLLSPLLAYLRPAAKKLADSATAKDGALSGLLPSAQTMAAMTAIPLAGFLLVIIDAAAHRTFQQERAVGLYALAASAGLSVLLGRAYDFLNTSSLHRTYASRLTRTFLGASNSARYGAVDDAVTADINVVDPDDDLDFDQYRPHETGGPLHLMGVCVNETIEAASEIMSADRKGRPMCVSPCGVSVGRGYHATWVPRQQAGPLTLREWIEGPVASAKDRPIALKACESTDGALFHPLKPEKDRAVAVDPLQLSSWMSISGAAYGTGTGRTTGFATSLLKALANVRLGYWWDTSLERGGRPGVAHHNFWRALVALVPKFFRMQSLLLAEFVGGFRGPSQRFWYLSDGGHFDVTGLYELIRRQVPFIIAVDGDEDSEFSWPGTAELKRTVASDFGATFDFIEPTGLSDAGLPPWIAGWLKTAGLGSREQIGKPGGRHAILARVTYTGSARVSWILILKASLTGDESIDILANQKVHPAFPFEPTSNQFFDEAQYDSYRALGEHVALGALQ